jgi:hypothetical protein
MAYLPESPRWLLKGGRETEAADVLKRVHGSAHVIAEIADIKADLELERDTIGWRQLLGPTFRRPMLLGVGLAIFQQITGINTVIYYAPTIFQSAGFKSATAAILATAGVGVDTISVVYLRCRFGCRTLEQADCPRARDKRDDREAPPGQRHAKNGCKVFARPCDQGGAVGTVLTTGPPPYSI